jgi:hypothetical protein
MIRLTRSFPIVHDSGTMADARHAGVEETSRKRRSLPLLGLRPNREVQYPSRAGPQTRSPQCCPVDSICLLLVGRVPSLRPQVQKYSSGWLRRELSTPRRPYIIFLISWLSGTHADSTTRHWDRAINTPNRKYCCTGLESSRIESLIATEPRSKMILVLNREHRRPCIRG